MTGNTIQLTKVGLEASDAKEDIESSLAGLIDIVSLATEEEGLNAHACRIVLRELMATKMALEKI